MKAFFRKRALSVSWKIIDNINNNIIKNKMKKNKKKQIIVLGARESNNSSKGREDNLSWVTPNRRHSFRIFFF